MKLSYQISSKTFSPFGVTLTNRNYNSSHYRYGFQNQEKDDELKGDGNSVNFTYRMHDTRLGRFFAVDPLSYKYPYNSNYAFSENRVLDCRELEGLEAWEVKRQWQPGDLQKYQDYSKTELERLSSSTEKFQCKDLALHLIIQFAAKEGLPLTLITEASSISNSTTTFEHVANKQGTATSKIEKGDLDQFEKLVFSYTGVTALSKNTYAVSEKEEGAGDMYLATIGGEALAHTVVIGVPNTDPKKEVVYQASMVDNGPTLVTKDDNWISTYNVETYAGSNNVSRFTVFLEIEKNVKAAKPLIQASTKALEAVKNAAKKDSTKSSTWKK